MSRMLNKRQADTSRAAIQTTQLINRLQDCALGKVELTTQQVKSIEILLKKNLPDLKSMELTGLDGGPIEYKRGVIRYERPGTEAGNPGEAGPDSGGPAPV